MEELKQGLTGLTLQESWLRGRLLAHPKTMLPNTNFGGVAIHVTMFVAGSVFFVMFVSSHSRSLQLLQRIAEGNWKG